MTDSTTTDDEMQGLRGLWLSRSMFNPFVGWPVETRSFDEFVRDHYALASPVVGQPGESPAGTGDESEIRRSGGEQR